MGWNAAAFHPIFICSSEFKQQKKASQSSPCGWVSYLHRAATTDYLCCGQALEDLSGAGRTGLTHILAIYQYQLKKTPLLRFAMQR